MENLTKTGASNVEREAHTNKTNPTLLRLWKYGDPFYEDFEPRPGSISTDTTALKDFVKLFGTVQFADGFDSQTFREEWY